MIICYGRLQSGAAVDVDPIPTKHYPHFVEFSTAFVVLNLSKFAI